MRKEEAKGVYILSENGRELVNLDRFSEVFIRETTDNVIVAATESKDSAKIVLGRYAKLKDAEAAILAICEAQEAGRRTFTMPPNLGPEIANVHDARVKRKGGS